MFSPSLPPPRRRAGLFAVGAGGLAGIRGTMMLQMHLMMRGRRLPPLPSSPPPRPPARSGGGGRLEGTMTVAAAGTEATVTVAVMAAVGRCAMPC